MGWNRKLLRTGTAALAGPALVAPAATAAPAPAPASTAAPAGSAGFAGPVCQDGVLALPELQVDTLERVAVRLCEGRRPRTITVFRARNGRGVVDAYRRGNRLAVLTVRDEEIGEVRVLDVRTRRVLVDLSFRTRPGEFEPGVALLADGAVAWTEQDRLRVRLRSGRVRTVTTWYSGKLAVEDGRTLRWGVDGEYGAPVQYADVLPFPAGGCPHRAAFVPVAKTDQFVITGRTAPEPRDLVRVCDEATGRDRVVSIGGEQQSARFVAFSGTFAAVVTGPTSRYAIGCPMGVALVDLRLGRVVHEGWGSGLCDDPDAVVLAPDGTIAFTHLATYDAPRPHAVYVLRPGRAREELDRGAIDGLRLDGSTLRWRRDGQERAAAL